MAFKHHVVPLGIDSGVLYVASATPLSRELDLELRVIADCMVSLVWAPKALIDQRLSHENHAQSPLGETGPHPPMDVHALLTQALIEMKSGDEQELVNAVNESSSVIKLVNQMILDAYEQKASDIHIETNPGDDVSRVRFRKDGDLEDYLQLPTLLRSAVVSRIKIMSRLTFQSDAVRRMAKSISTSFPASSWNCASPSCRLMTTLKMLSCACWLQANRYRFKNSVSLTVTTRLSNV